MSKPSDIFYESKEKPPVTMWDFYHYYIENKHRFIKGNRKHKNIHRGKFKKILNVFLRKCKDDIIMKGKTLKLSVGEFTVYRKYMEFPILKNTTEGRKYVEDDYIFFMTWKRNKRVANLTHLKFKPYYKTHREIWKYTLENELNYKTFKHV